MTGVDLTRIEGIDVSTALTIISETGIDMSKWPTDKHFSSWPALCPGSKISGGKILSSKSKRVLIVPHTPFAWPRTVFIGASQPLELF